MAAMQRRHRGVLLAALCLLAAACIAALPAQPAAASTFSNSGAITVADATPCGPPPTPGVGSLYPSTIAVSGLTGTVTDVNVTLSNITYAFGDDLDVLLVGPGGGTQNLVLLSDAGSGPISTATATFDDSAAGSVPQNGSWSTGTYKPTNYTNLTPNDVDTFPAPAPSPSATTTLSGAFNGISPNGTWSLYVTDDSCSGTGSIAGGWSLDITTASAAAATTTSVSASPTQATTDQPVTFTATVTSGGSPVTTGTVTFSEGATTLQANVALSGSGMAAFTTSSLAEGDHTITATYNGTASFGISSGTASARLDNATTVTGTTFCNAGAIALPVVGAATPYPSNIFVTGLSGTVSDVTVQLKNVTHGFEGDFDVLLVGPGGGSRNLVLLSDAGTGSLSNADVGFSDAAASAPPQNSAWGAGTYKPVNYTELSPADSYPAPAPSPSSSTTLAGAFAGGAPNGTWSLYVVDDQSPDAGSVAGGWCVTVTAKVSPTLSTIASGAVAVGATVGDTATLSGGSSPTGTVTFRLFGPNDATCATTPVFTSTVAVSAGSATSASFTPTSPGTYRWTAAYSGDVNNAAVAAPCNAANESVGVSQATPTLATTASAGVAIGGSVTDTATLTGGAGPTGTVTFGLYGPNDATCATTPAFTSTVAVSAGTATSAAFTPTTAGTYRWRAAYSGDVNNAAVAAPCNAANESVAVASAAPTLTATATPGAVDLGTPLAAGATLLAGRTPAGTVTFRLYGPDLLCSGPPLATSTRTVTGNGSYASDPVTPAAPGNYHWVAAYSGDAGNAPVTTACGAADQFVRTAEPHHGFWLAGRDGAVFALGGAEFHGSLGDTRPNQPVVGMAATPTGRGYWLVAADGGVFAFGDAGFHGSLGAMHLNQPVEGMAASPTGGGYWLVAADGGVFAFGDAGFHGSLGAMHLNQRIVGMAATPTGRGYWLVAADGGVFALGDAPFLGSSAGSGGPPVVGLAPTTTGRGYWTADSAGGVVADGDAGFASGPGGAAGPAPLVAITAQP